MFKRIKKWLKDREMAKAGYATFKDPHGKPVTRGRLYINDQSMGPIKVKSQPKITITARVYRAATDTWEHI